MTDNGGNQLQQSQDAVELAVRIENFIGNLRQMVYEQVPDDIAFEQMDDLLVTMGSDMVMFIEASRALREQRDDLNKENEQILQSLDEWTAPSHPKVAELIEAIEQNVWEVAGPESIAYAHETMREELIEALSVAIMDKYPIGDSYRLAANMTDLLLDLPDSDYSDNVRHILQMLAEELNQKDKPNVEE